MALILWLSSTLKDWENFTWAWRVKYWAKPSPFTEDIKVVLIDQASLDWGASESGLPWPWPREVYVPILDFCRRGGAKVIAFDMIYSEPSAYMAADDAIFGQAIGKSNDFVAAFFIGEQAGQALAWPDHIPHPPIQLGGVAEWRLRRPDAFADETRASFPIPEVATNATLIANVREVPDHDGTFRRSTPFRFFDHEPVPLLALGTYLVGNESAPYRLTLDHSALRVGARSIPLDAEGRAILRFRGKSGTHETLSAAAMIQSELRLAEGAEPVIDPAELKDKYVFLGVSAPGLKDLQSTPISGDYPGVEVHATFLDNLLAQDFLRQSPRLPVALATWLFAVFAAGLVLNSRTIKGSIASILAVMSVPALFGFIAYPWGWWWPIIGPQLAVLLAVVVSEVVNYSTEGRQKRFIKSAFKQYLSGDVIEQILDNPGQLKLGGEKRELSIFFSDLQGFSSISEKLDPEQLTALLNDYLTDMSDIIMEEGGTVDKYEGDAIIAFWNAPLPQPDHAVRACRAALRCQRSLEKRRSEFAHRTGADMYMRIGIHTGEVVVGNMGSHNRFNYTVLGDAANLASRLEGANKPFGTYLMISETTWKYARDAGFHMREIGPILVVGRKTPVRVYEVVGLPDEAAPTGLIEWNQAMIYCHAGQWSQANDIFAKRTDDPVAKTYLRQCEKVISGQLESWDGVWKLTEK